MPQFKELRGRKNRPYPLQGCTSLEPQCNNPKAENPLSEFSGKLHSVRSGTSAWDCACASSNERASDVLDDTKPLRLG